MKGRNENTPGLRWQVFLGKELCSQRLSLENETYQSNWTNHPGYLHHRKESDFYGRSDLIKRFRASCLKINTRLGVRGLPITAMEAR